MTAKPSLRRYQIVLRAVREKCQRAAAQFFWMFGRALCAVLMSLDKLRAGKIICFIISNSCLLLLEQPCVAWRRER